MKIQIILISLLFSFSSAQSQLTIIKKDGGSVVTKLGFGIKVNDGSSLNREWININDATCPIQISEVGINTGYSGGSYVFKSTGQLNVKEDITAFELYHVLYDVFGEHFKTLSQKEIIDINSSFDISKKGTWYANENEVSEYLICVTYVANVRKKDGSVWRYNYNGVKEQLNALKIAFEESYQPQKDKSNDKNNGKSK
nr:hypothetical protein [uncultured Sediminibacterium sp.]